MQFHNVFVPVQTLQKPDIKPGGWCWVLFFPWHQVEAWPQMDPQNGVISGNLLFKPGAKVFSLKAIEKNRTFKESLERATAGPYMKAEVTGILPSNTVQIITTMVAMQYMRWGVLLQDRSGQQRLLGSPDAGAELDQDYTTADINGSRLRNIKFLFEAIQIPIYQGGNLVIDNTIIPVGGNLNSNTNEMALHASFEVGAPGAPMVDGQSTYTHAALIGKRVWVFVDGIKLSSVVNAAKRYVIKDTAEDTFTVMGGVSNGEAIEIFIY